MVDIFDLSDAPTVEPVEFTAGDLVQWRRTDYSDYADGLYTFEYVFRPSDGGDEVAVVASISGTEFHISMSSSVTATMRAARWHWQAYIIRTSDSARIQVDVGSVYVRPNLVNVADDTRSHARKMLDQIEALIEGKGLSDVESYTIGGRQINKMSAMELTNWRTHYRNEVAAEDDIERRRRGLASRNTIRMRFV